MPNGSQSSTKPKSNKTTIGGLIASGGLLLTSIAPILDGDTETVMEVEHLTMVVASFGVLAMSWFARDNDVSSEGKKIV